MSEKQITALEVLQQQMRQMNNDIDDLRDSQSATESATEKAMEEELERQETDKLSMNTSQERYTGYDSNAASTTHDGIMKKQKPTIIQHRQGAKYSTITSKGEQEMNSMRGFKTSQGSMKKSMNFHNRPDDNISATGSRLGADSEAASLKQLRKANRQRRDNSGESGTINVVGGNYTTDRSTKEDRYFQRVPNPKVQSSQVSKRHSKVRMNNGSLQYVTDAQTRNWAHPEQSVAFVDEASKFHTDEDGGRLQYYNQRRPQSGYKMAVLRKNQGMIDSQYSIQHQNQRKSMRRVYGAPASLKMAQGMVSKSHRKLVKAGGTRKSSKEKALGLEQFYQGGYMSHASGYAGKPFGSMMKSKKSRSRSKKLDNFVENHPIADSINIKVFSSDVERNPGQETENDEENDPEEDMLLAYYAKKFQAKELARQASPSRPTSTTRTVYKDSTIEVEQLENDLKNSKITAHKLVDENKKLRTFNRQLQKEIYSNERVIEVIMKKMANITDKSDRTSTTNFKRATQHFGMMVQCKAQIREYKIENQKLRDQVEKMRKNVGLTSNVEVISENQQLKYHIKAMQDTMIKMQKQIHTLKNQNGVATDSTTNNQKLLEFEEVAKQQQQRIEKLQDQCYELKKKGEVSYHESEELEKVRKECEKFKSEKMNFELELQQLKEEREREFYPMKRALEDAQSKIQDKEIQVEQLQLSLNNANQSLKNSNINFDQAQANIQRLEQMMELMEANKIQSPLKGAAPGSAASDKSIKILESAQNEIEELKGLLRKKSESLEASDSKIQTLTKIVDDHQASLTSKNEEIRSLTEQIEQVQKVKSSIPAPSQSPNASLQQELTGLQDKNSSLNLQIQTLSQELTQVKSACEAQKQDAKTAWEQSEQKDGKIQELMDLIGSMEKDMEAYKMLAQQNQGGDGDKLRDSMGEFMGQKKVMEDEIRSLKQLTTDLNAKVLDADEKVINQERDIIKKDRKISKMKEFIEKLKDDSTSNYIKLKSFKEGAYFSDASIVSDEMFQSHTKLSDKGRYRSGSKKKVEFALEEDEGPRPSSLEKQESTIKTYGDLDRVSKELEEKEKMYKELMDSKNVSNDLQNQLKEREEKIRSLSNENTTMLSQMTNLQEWKVFLEEKIQDKRTQIKDLKRYARDLKSRSREPTMQPQNSAAEAKQIDLTNQRELQEEIKQDMKEAMTEQYTDAKAKQKILEVTEDLKKSLEQKDEEVSKLKEFQKSIEQKEEEISKLKMKLQTTKKKEKERSLERLNTIQKQDDEFATKFEELEAEYLKEKENSNYWSNESKRWQDQFTKIEADLKKAQQETPVFAKAKQVSDEQLLEANKQKDMFKGLSDEYKQVIDKLTKEQSQFKADQSQLQSELSDANNKVKVLTMSLDQKTKEMTYASETAAGEFKIQLTAKDTEITELKDQHAIALQTIEKLSTFEKKCAQLQNDLLKADNEISAHETTFDELQSKNKDLKAQLDKMQAEAQQKSQEPDKNQDTMTYLLQQNEVKLKDQQTELDKATKELKDAQYEVKMLTMALEQKTKEVEQQMFEVQAPVVKEMKGAVQKKAGDQKVDDAELKKLEEANQKLSVEIEGHLKTIQQRDLENEELKKQVEQIQSEMGAVRRSSAGDPAQTISHRQSQIVMRQPTEKETNALKSQLKQLDSMSLASRSNHASLRDSQPSKLSGYDSEINKSQQEVKIQKTTDMQIQDEQIMEKQQTVIAKSPGTLDKQQSLLTRKQEDELKELQQQVKNYKYSNERYFEELTDARQQIEQEQIKHNKDMFKRTQELQKQLMDKDEYYNQQLDKQKIEYQRQLQDQQSEWTSKIQAINQEFTKIQQENSTLKKDLLKFQSIEQKQTFGRKQSGNDQSMNYSLTDNNNTIPEGSPDQEFGKGSEIYIVKEEAISPKEVQDKPFFVEAQKLEEPPSDPKSIFMAAAAAEFSLPSQNIPSSSQVQTSSQIVSSSVTTSVKKGGRPARPTSAHPKGRGGKSGFQSGTDDEYQTSAIVSGSEAYATGNEDLQGVEEISDYGEYDDELEQNVKKMNTFAEFLGSDSEQIPKK